jgi:hypothetical protein
MEIEQRKGIYLFCVALIDKLLFSEAGYRGRKAVYILKSKIDFICPQISLLKTFDTLRIHAFWQFYRYDIDICTVSHFKILCQTIGPKNEALRK